MADKHDRGLTIAVALLQLDKLSHIQSVTTMTDGGKCSLVMYISQNILKRGWTFLNWALTDWSLAAVHWLITAFVRRGMAIPRPFSVHISQRYEFNTYVYLLTLNRLPKAFSGDVIFRCQGQIRSQSTINIVYPGDIEWWLTMLILRSPDSLVNSFISKTQWNVFWLSEAVNLQKSLETSKESAFQISVRMTWSEPIWHTVSGIFHKITTLERKSSIAYS